MKKVFKISSALFVAAFMCVFGSMTAFAATWDIDHSWQLIQFEKENAPEGTVFADILIKDKMIKRIQAGEIDNER